ncbi:hypothetical protein TP41_04940 [Xanthomonas euvesicatoria pv. citrumelonis]|nr:hypothetical protein Xcom_08295 [Xanthomonas axonopodis pv. commiphoreae]TKA20724.1 hypothetical protein TP41_04940 [Xanthomonas euvesicatoria pv. citrumelonis]
MQAALLKLGAGAIAVRTSPIGKARALVAAMAGLILQRKRLSPGLATAAAARYRWTRFWQRRSCNTNEVAWRETYRRILNAACQVTCVIAP